MLLIPHCVQMTPAYDFVTQVTQKMPVQSRYEYFLQATYASAPALPLPQSLQKVSPDASPLIFYHCRGWDMWHQKG